MQGRRHEAVVDGDEQLCSIPRARQKYAAPVSADADSLPLVSILGPFQVALDLQLQVRSCTVLRGGGGAHVARRPRQRTRAAGYTGLLYTYPEYDRRHDILRTTIRCTTGRVDGTVHCSLATGRDTRDTRRER